MTFYSPSMITTAAINMGQESIKIWTIWLTAPNILIWFLNKTFTPFAWKLQISNPESRNLFKLQQNIWVYDNSDAHFYGFIYITYIFRVALSAVLQRLLSVPKCIYETHQEILNRCFFIMKTNGEKQSENIFKIFARMMLFWRNMFSGFDSSNVESLIKIHFWKR